MKKKFFFIIIERGILFDNIETGILFNNIEKDENRINEIYYFSIIFCVLRSIIPSYSVAS
jgi:hypothetical protein